MRGTWVGECLGGQEERRGGRRMDRIVLAGFSQARAPPNRPSETGLSAIDGAAASRRQEPALPVHLPMEPKCEPACRRRVTTLYN